MYLTPYTRTWLEPARYVRVLHVLDGVCNLIDTNSQVVSLAIPQIGKGPFSIVAPPLRFSDHITPTDPVFCCPDSVKIGKISVDLDTATIWNPRPAWDSQIRERLYHHRPLLIRALIEFAPPNSLAALIVDLPGGVSETDAAILQTARTAAAELIAGLQANALTFDSSAACFQEGAAQLAGLGIGVTPAGDDWLVGGLLALRSMLPETRADSIGTLIARAAAPRTTPLSAAWLGAAARGECHEHWHALLEGIQADDEGAVGAAAAALIRHGHTSGADALAGFVMVLTALGASAGL